MRLPYASPTPPSTAFPSSIKPGNGPTAEEAYAQLSARRSPKPLQALDLTLLHSPPIASGWSSFLGAVRTQTSLPADIRELCICRVAVLNGAAYEWDHHAPILKTEGELCDVVLNELKQRKAWQGWEDTIGGGGDGEGEVGGGLNEKQRAVLAYADAMTIGVHVPDEIFEGLRKVFGEREVVEITATVAAYNCVSRFLVALDVGEMSEREEK